MTLDLNALGLLLIAGLVGGGLKLLLNRMSDQDEQLTGLGIKIDHHGRKLVRIETKMGIWDIADRGDQ